MSASSGIDLSSELNDVFANAVQDSNIRFLKISIKDEKLVPEASFPKTAETLDDDLPKLQEILEDTIPAYVLARLDGAGAGWLVVNYVPDTATVRDKMLYASTRSSLTKSLGATHFTDSLFATSKADLTAEAYSAHRMHMNAPKPTTAQEKDMEQVREAERSGSFEGSRARKNHVGTRVGLGWTEEAEAAVKKLGEGEADELLLLRIDIENESLVVVSSTERSVNEVADVLPSSEPSLAFFAWKHDHAPQPRRDIIFIYSCPSASPIKNRMVYSLSAASLLHSAKSLLSGSNSHLVSKKLETSDPKEINDAFIVSQLNLDRDDPDGELETSRPGSAQPKGFAKPKGPGRKR